MKFLFAIPFDNINAYDACDSVYVNVNVFEC